jgi:3-oxoadipate enol-lactonase
MQFAELGDVRIRYELTGDASLPVLVLSHSLGVSLQMWEPQMAALAPYFRLLRYDARGHGHSSVPPGPYEIADMARDVLGLLDFLNIEYANFCGLSMGASVGLWLGVNAPSRLQKLVVANTAAKIGSAETWNARIDLVLHEGVEPVIAGTLQRWFTPAFHTSNPRTIGEFNRMLRATTTQGYIASCAAVRDADFRSQLSGIEVPTLVIAGSIDPVTTALEGRAAADQITGATFVELPAAHLSSTEAATEFNQSLITFLRA